MKNAHFLFVFFLNIAVLSAQETFQLAPPLLKYPSVFFSKEAKIEMAFAEPNTEIHFTTNGEDPTEHDPIYKTPLRITKSYTCVKARVFSKIYQTSDVSQVTFIKDGLPIKAIDCTPPNPKYAGSGAQTLIDNKGGTTALSSKTWLGFQSDTVEIILTLDKKRKIDYVFYEMLRDYGSWVFLPDHVEVFYFNTKTKTFQSFGNQTFTPDKVLSETFCSWAMMPTQEKIKTDKIKLQFFILKKIPDWHAGHGNRSWIFIDEVKVY